MQILNLSANVAQSAIRRMLLYVLFLVGVSCYQSAAFAGSACIPFGYGTNAGASPETRFLATGAVAVKKLLYQRTWTPPLSTTDCITDPNASFFIAPDFSGTIFNTIYGRTATAVANGVQIEFEANDDATAFGINEPLFTIKYTTTMVCGNGGGLTVAPDSTRAGFVISGINSSGCDGNYLVTYDIKVWQAATTTFPSVTKSKQMGERGFREIHEMRHGSGAKAYIRGAPLNNSDKHTFVTHIGCTVSIPSGSSISLPNTSLANIANNPGLSARYFDVTLTNCQGGNVAPPLGVRLTWRFVSVDPNDTKLMTNSDARPSAAKNIGLRMYIVGASGFSRPVTHQLPLNSFYSLPTDPSSIVTIRHFVQYDLTLDGVADRATVQPGQFSAQAQLFVQYQ
jgi:type 1 fimbria pilin